MTDLISLSVTDLSLPATVCGKLINEDPKAYLHHSLLRPVRQTLASLSSIFD
eukprot:COSAG06_NODE_1571_length_9064_cov_22.348689_3_plen_52_part_00